MLSRAEILQGLRFQASLMVEVVERYKTPGQYETYGPYEEGRADMADVVCQYLEQLLRDADAPPRDDKPCP